MIRMIRMVEKEYILLARKKKFTAMLLLLPLFIGAIFAMLPNLLGLEGVKIGVCDLDDTTQSNDAVKEIMNKFEVDNIEDNCIDKLKQSIRQDENVVGLLIEKGFADKIEKFQQAEIVVYFDNTKFNLENYLSWFMDRALSDYKQKILLTGEVELKVRTENLYEISGTAYEIVNNTEANIGIPLSIVKNSVKDFRDLVVTVRELDTKFLANPVSNMIVGVYPIYSQLGVSFTIVFGILNLFTILMIASTGAISDRNSNYIVRIRTSGVFTIEYLASKIAIFLAISILQFALLFILFELRGADFGINLLGVFSAILLITSLNTLIGLAVGIVSENETMAILMSLILTLPFLFLSGIFAPIEFFPKIFQLLSTAFPLSVEIELLKKVMLLDENIETVWKMIEPLLNYLTAFAVMNILLLRKK